MVITNDVPERVKEFEAPAYGYIEGDSLTDDKIEYACQASEGANIYMIDHGSYVWAFLSSHNFTHLEQRLYICLPLNEEIELKEGSYSVKVQFEVKHSYFNNLHEAVVNLPPYVISCLLPHENSFKQLKENFQPQWSFYDFMKLDNDKQAKALKMIVSSVTTNVTPCPPVILFGPFGSGKTCILARAAYEIMINGISTKARFTRILICAHHPKSIESFIVDYFAQIKGHNLRFDVFLVSMFKGNPYLSSRNPKMKRFYKTFDDLIDCDPEQDYIYVIIISSYNSSLHLYNILNVPDHGYFNYIFLDEAAQVREPEAITPLALATIDAKIVLAGDDKQV